MMMKSMPRMLRWKTKHLPFLDLMSTKVTSKKGVLQVNDCFTSGLMTSLSMLTHSCIALNLFNFSYFITN